MKQQHLVGSRYPKAWHTAMLFQLALFRNVDAPDDISIDVFPPEMIGTIRKCLFRGPVNTCYSCELVE